MKINLLNKKIMTNIKKGIKMKKLLAVLLAAVSISNIIPLSVSAESGESLRHGVIAQDSIVYADPDSLTIDEIFDIDDISVMESMLKRYNKRISKEIKEENKRRKEEYNKKVEEVAEARRQEALEEAEYQRINTTPNLLTIPSAGISIIATEDNLSQENVDNNLCLRLVDYDKIYGGLTFFGHNTTGRFKTLYTAKIGDIITYVDSEGVSSHYKIFLSEYGLIKQDFSVKGELKPGHIGVAYVTSPSTGEVLFIHNGEHVSDDTLSIMTCHKYEDPDGRWIVKAKKVD